MLKRSKYTLALLLAFCLVFGSLMSSASAAVPQDVQKHWAAKTLEKWIDAGLITGYADGSIKPDAPVKRAELAVMINRAFGLTEAGDVSFSDLPKDHWAYHDIAIAVTAGYIHGIGNGKVSPNGKATRQEAAQMIASALGLNTQTAGDLSQFRDAAKITDWGKGAVAALAAKNIFKGDENNDFRPNAPITRAESVVALDAAMAIKAPIVFDKPGAFGPANGTNTINGNVVIKSDGVTLQNTVINGNLTIAKEVGEGDVTLKNVTVKGTTNVNGGGENSVHLEDSVLLRIIVEKATGKVRIVAIGATSVQDVIVNSSVKIEESHVTDSGFSNIELSSTLPAGSSVDLVGQFEDVRVLSANIQLNIPSGSIQNLSVAEGASNNTINLGKEAQVLQLVLNAVSKLIGEGQIGNATVNEQAKGSTFETKPDQVSGNGKDDTAPPSTGATGGNNGSGNGSGNDNGNGSGSDKCTSACDDASLKSLTIVSGKSNLQLVQRGDNHNILGSGFDSTSFSYTVDIPKDFVESDVSISVAAAANARVFYSIYYDDARSELDTLPTNKGKISFHLNPKHDVEVGFFITSGDGIRYKYYNVLFNYERDLQEAFSIKNGAYDSQYPFYFLQSASFELGDEISITVPASDTEAGTEMTFTQMVEDYYFTLHLDDYVAQNKFDPKSTQGTVYIEVKRAGKVIMNGDYHYDLTPVNQIANGSGINVDLWTQDQIRDYDAMNNEVYNTSYVLSMKLDTAQADIALKNAASISTDWSYKFYTDSAPRIWTKEDLKTSQNKFWGIYAHSRFNSDSSPLEHFFINFTEVYPQYLYLFFYDASDNFLGYYVYDLNFDEDHVGSSVIIKQPMDRP